MWLIPVLLLIPLIYFYVDRRLHSYWKRRGVFQAEPDLIFGNITAYIFRWRPLTFIISDLYRQYKEKCLVGIYSLYNPILLVTKPDLIKRIMITDFNNYFETGFEIDASVETLFALNPFMTTDFELWKERRGLHVSTLTPSKLKAIPALLVGSGNSMVEYVRGFQGKPQNLKEVCEVYSLDAATTSAYGVEPTAYTDPQNVFMLNGRDEMFTEHFDSMFMGSMLYPAIQKLFKRRMFSEDGIHFFEGFTKQLMAQRKEASSRGDVVDAVIKADQKRISLGREALSDLEKTGHALTAYLDSYFTTSRVLRTFLLDLAEYPDVQERLRSEIRSKGGRIEEFNVEAVQSIKYLQMAVSETLRKHPPLQILTRKCSTKSELGGVEIERGTKIFIPVVDLHYDQEYWPEPEVYRPERFESEEGITKGTFIPFGEGPRMCLGFRYAQLIMKLAAINLLLNFKISFEKGTEVKKLYDQGYSIFVEPSSSVNLIFEPL